MSKLINQVFLHNEYAEIKVKKTGDFSYEGTVLIDLEDLLKVGKVRLSRAGYAFKCSDGGKNISHVVMNHQSNMETVVDHINNNKLDNRKKNLRIVHQKDNANNRGSSRNNTGIVGIALRSVGGYEFYRVTVFDRNTPVKSGKTKSACKRYSKQFNINKLGKEEAFQAAKNWLDEKRKEFGYIDY